MPVHSNRNLNWTVYPLERELQQPGQKVKYPLRLWDLQKRKSPQSPNSLPLPSRTDTLRVALARYIKHKTDDVAFWAGQRNEHLGEGILLREWFSGAFTKSMWTGGAEEAILFKAQTNSQDSRWYCSSVASPEAGFGEFFFFIQPEKSQKSYASSLSWHIFSSPTSRKVAKRVHSFPLTFSCEYFQPSASGILWFSTICKMPGQMKDYPSQFRAH